jgi:prefoldin alpha subunit
MPISKEEEQELEKESYYLDQIKHQLDTMLEQREMFATAYGNVERALMSINALKVQKAGSEMLVPVGGECFVNATISSTDKAIVGVGANIYLERDADAALEILSKRKEAITGNLQNLEKAISELDAKGQELSKRLQEKYARAQEEPVMGAE